MKQVTDQRILEPKERGLALKASVMKLLKWSEMDFAEFQYESGLTYLKAYLPKDVYGQEALAASKIFWNWWKNQWANRDEVFYLDVTDTEISLLNRVRLYRALHDGYNLTKEIHPHRVVMEESYAIMVTDFVEKEKQDVKPI